MLASILAFSLFACGPKAPPAAPSFPQPPADLDGKSPQEALKSVYGRSLAILLGDSSDVRTAPSLKRLSTTLVSSGFEVMPIAELPTSSGDFEKKITNALKNDIQNVDRLLVYYVGGGSSTKEGAFELRPNDHSVSTVKSLKDEWSPYVRHFFMAIDACGDSADPAMTSVFSPMKRNVDLPQAMVQSRSVAVVAGYGPECKASQKEATELTPMTQALIAGFGNGLADLNKDGLITDREWFAAYSHKVKASDEVFAIGSELGSGSIIFPHPQSSSLSLTVPYETIRVFSDDYEMGSAASENLALHRSDELRHSVSLSHDLLVGRTEVPQTLWQSLSLPNPSVHRDDSAPVNNISWYDAVNFANALSTKDGLKPCYEINMRRWINKVTWKQGPSCTGWRLPTEAEWEYFARAGSQLNFTTGQGSESLPADFANEDGCESATLSKGSQLDSLAWYCNNSVKPQNHPKGVGLLDANAFGLYDVHGNVWEWVWDRYGPYPKDAVTDPVGPNRSSSCGNAGDSRVRRGGSWVNDARSLRLAFRNCLNPGDSRSHIGVRLVRSVAKLPSLTIEDAAILPVPSEGSEPDESPSIENDDVKADEAIKAETSPAAEPEGASPEKPAKASSPKGKTAEEATDSATDAKPSTEESASTVEPKRKRGRQISKPESKEDGAEVK